MRARQPQVATPAEIKAPGPLREATLHPGPQRILGFELRGPLALPRRLERLMVGLQPDRKLAGSILRPRTYWTGRTAAEGGLIKPDAHDGSTGTIPARGPPDNGVRWGTAYLVCLPSDHTGREVIGLAR